MTPEDRGIIAAIREYVDCNEEVTNMKAYWQHQSCQSCQDVKLAAPLQRNCSNKLGFLIALLEREQLRSLTFKKVPSASRTYFYFVILEYL